MCASTTFWVELNNKMEQNVTKPTKLNKTTKILLLHNKTTKYFVPSQQNSKTAKQQNNKITKYFVSTQQNNKIFCWSITKQQNFRIQLNKKTNNFVGLLITPINTGARFIWPKVIFITLLSSIFHQCFAFLGF